MKGNHAIVIGASISGLVAARVLSEHFGRVTVYDRDGLPASLQNRSGVPQGRHGHGLLASGFAGLKELLPALERTLLERGAIPGDVVGDLRWFQHGCYKAKFQSEFKGILLSRPLLEGTVREQVQQLPNVTIVDQTHISGLVTDDGGRRVTGIRIRRNDESLVADADFVVDASGRSSRAGEWLGELGYPKPSVDSVEIDLAYTTRTFRRRRTISTATWRPSSAPLRQRHASASFWRWKAIAGSCRWAGGLAIMRRRSRTRIWRSRARSRGPTSTMSSATPNR